MKFGNSSILGGVFMRGGGWNMDFVRVSGGINSVFKRMFVYLLSVLIRTCVDGGQGELNICLIKTLFPSESKKRYQLLRHPCLCSPILTLAQCLSSTVT